MLSLEEARRNILSKIQPLPAERVPASDAFHCHAAEDLASPIDLPLFDNSAMDGYAVREADLAAASPENPIRLRLAGRISAGKAGAITIASGECCRVFTGSLLPSCAGAVVMQEDTEVDGESIVFREPVRPFENIRLQGEDLRAGKVIARQGQVITPTRAALVSACGIESLNAHRKPMVGLIATGNELRSPGEKLEPGEIYESNRAMLRGFLRDLAHLPAYPVVPDDRGKTVSALREAFRECDLVLSSGGVSVGEYDFVKGAFEEMGGNIELWRIAIRPGKPFAFGSFNGKFFFGLPGNPVSSLVTFLLLVRPAILKLNGAAETELPVISGQLGEELINRGERRHFIRVRWDNGTVWPAGAQASHMLADLGEANGLLDVPAGSRLEKGTTVQARLWQLPDGGG
jgi:molybdopterin molybdotransferase